MSILEKSLKKTGLKLEADALPKEHRKVKVFQRLIAAVRAAEAEMIDRHLELEHQLNEALRQTAEARAEAVEAKSELIQYKLKERMSGMDGLTIADKAKMLECAVA
jgi:hypothetical protein